MKINGFVPDSSIFQTNNDNSKSKEASGLSFLDTLKEKLNDVNEEQIEANVLTDKMIKGEDVDIHQVMLKTEEAKMSLQLAVQVRNKILEAYQEINRIQL